MDHWESFWSDTALLKTALEQARRIPGHLREQKAVHHTDLVLSAAEEIVFPGLRLKLLERMEAEDLLVWESVCGQARRARLEAFHPQQGLACCDRIYRFLPEIADQEIVVGVQRLLGEYLLEAGRYRDAWGPLQDALQAALDARDNAYALSCRILLVRCMMGDHAPDEAREELAEAKALGRQILSRM